MIIMNKAILKLGQAIQKAILKLGWAILKLGQAILKLGQGYPKIGAIMCRSMFRIICRTMFRTITVISIIKFFEKHKKFIATQYHFVIRLQQCFRCHSYNKGNSTTIDIDLPLSYLVSINNLPVIQSFIIQSYNKELSSTSISGFDLSIIKNIITTNSCIGLKHYHTPLKSKDGIRDLKSNKEVRYAQIC